MRDQYNRQIDYMRISITDRCNMRCSYCMPHGVERCDHKEILTYEEIIRICKVAEKLGISKFKVTGGEPFVRKNALDFLWQLKNLKGVTSVTVTTNATYLDADTIRQLGEMQIDGVNVSLDTLDQKKFEAVTGTLFSSEKIVESIDMLLEKRIPTKVNTVLIQKDKREVMEMVGLVKARPLTLRFIEKMPIGGGTIEGGLTMESLKMILKEEYLDWQSNSEKMGNGPASYYKSKHLKGGIGMIGALSNPFCTSCNRIRLTSQGVLKTCLCYDHGIDLKSELRKGASDAFLEEIMKASIYEKPKAHCFHEIKNMTEEKAMWEIGG